MCSAFAPPHLLLFYHPVAHHLVDRRLGKGTRNSFPMPPPLSIVRNACLIEGNVAREFVDSFLNLHDFVRVWWPCLQSVKQFFCPLQRPPYITIPYIPFHTLPFFLQCCEAHSLGREFIIDRKRCGQGTALRYFH